MRSRVPRTAVMWMPPAAQARYRRQMVCFYVLLATQLASAGATLVIAAGSVATAGATSGLGLAVLVVSLAVGAAVVGLLVGQLRQLVRGVRLVRADGRLVVKRARIEEARRIAAACPQDAPWAPHRSVGPARVLGEPLLWVGVALLLVALAVTAATIVAAGPFVALGAVAAGGVGTLGLVLACGPLAWHRPGPSPRAAHGAARDLPAR